MRGIISTIIFTNMRLVIYVANLLIIMVLNIRTLSFRFGSAPEDIILRGFRRALPWQELLIAARGKAGKIPTPYPRP